MALKKKKIFFFQMGDVILGFGHFDNKKKIKNLGGRKKNLKKKKNRKKC